jgi:pseudouridine synthase
MAQLRLQKYLSQCGIASRRAAEEMIRKGEIFVNGAKASIGQKVDSDKDKIEVKNTAVKPASKKVYIMLNKPRGYICSCSDDQGRSIFDLVKVKEKVYPVGRLDKDSEGLVILTNDGELANKLTHPRYECEKEYEVITDGPLSRKQIEELMAGVFLGDEKTKPCRINRLDDNKFDIILREGKKRQIRRMFEEKGRKVIRLKRIRIKDLGLRRMRPGEWEYLGPKDVRKIQVSGQK